MSRLSELQTPLLLDGGMGTALSARGLDPRAVPSSAWNLARPEVVRSIHRGFVEAGADVILSNTFSANPGQAGAFPRAEIEAWNREGVVLARAERPSGVIVAGNIGPTGLLPPPEGAADLAELEDWFAAQASLLVGAGADWLVLETFYHPKEARAAVRAARQVAPAVPIIGSMSCRLVAGQWRTSSGLSLRGMIRAFVEEGADAVGANCAQTPEEMVPLVETIRGMTTLPIFAKPTVAPNGGAPLYPGEFALGLCKLVAAGAVAVGGCCGTSAADLAAARAALAELPRPTSRQETRPLSLHLA